MKELYAALAKAQGEFKSIHKNKEVIKKGRTKDGREFSYGYKYADLHVILETVRPVLSKNGLSVTQSIEDDTCVTKISHDAGDALLSECPIVVEPGDMQKLGAAITYARRYGLSLALGITTDDDLDANELQNDPAEIRDASKTHTVDRAQRVISSGVVAPSPETSFYLDNLNDSKEPKPFVRYPLSEKQIKRLYAIGMNSQWSGIYVDAYLSATFAKFAKDLSRQEYDIACLFLEKNPCNEIFKEQFKSFCVKRESAAAAKKKGDRSSYSDHTKSDPAAEPPFPEGPWSPQIDQNDPFPF